MASKKDEEVAIVSYKLTNKRLKKTTKKVAYEKTFLAKAEEWEHEKKTKQFERLQAVSRHPQYMKEYEKLKELDGTFSGIALWEEFLEKYKSGKRKPVDVWGKDYQNFNLYLEGNAEYQKKLSAIHKKVEKKRSRKLEHEVAMLQKWKVQELPCLWFPDNIIESQRMYKDRPAIIELRNISKMSNDPKESGYVFLQLDLSRKRADIKNELMELLEIYPKPKTDRFLKYDKWVVYDMHSRDGINYTRITRMLSGLSGNPSYNSDLANELRNVRTAYGKAEECIQQVGT
jgi:hypothetical protein